MTNAYKETNKPKIEIWDTVGLGLIINYPSGVLVSNQTGGTSCLHPCIEGIYIPLHNDYSETDKQFLSPEIDLEKYFVGPKYMGSGATKGIDKEDISNITEILTKYGLNEFISVDREKMEQSHEAWIYVNIKNLYLLSNFPVELSGILTWNNSD